MGLYSTSHAATLLVSGFDVVDTAGTESLAFTETLGGTAATGDCATCTQSATCQVHNDLNGGSSTSAHALKVDVTSGETAYYTTDTTMSASQLTSHISLHVPSAPAGALTVHDHLEGASEGCLLQLNTDLTITVKDGDGNTFGTTTKTTQDSYCSGGTACASNTACVGAGLGEVCVATVCQDIRTPCTGAGDCVSGSCGSCTTATGAGCYHASLQLVTTTFGTSRLCELRWDGQLVVTGTALAATTGNVTAVRVGAISDPGGAATLYFDDLVIETDDDIGMTFVHAQCVATDSTPIDFTTDSCGAGSTHERCIDDYCTGTNLLDGGFLKKSAPGKEETFSAVETIPVASLTVSALDSTIIGSQSGTNAFDFLHQPMLCDPTCTNLVPSSTVSGTGSTTNRLLDRMVYTTTGIAGSQELTEARLNKLGLRWQNGGGNATTNRIHAHVLAAAIRRADTPPKITLCQTNGDLSDVEDHNDGTNDGVCWVMTIGDSTLGDTLAVSCQNSTNAGTLCSQHDYASWDTVDKDKPAGGCQGNDARVQTCANRRDEFNGAAGYPCGDQNDDQTCALGTCSGGFCTGDTDVSCTVNDDCDLGDCDTCGNADCAATAATSTCEVSCPGAATACTTDAQCSGGQRCDLDRSECHGICPTDRGSWGTSLAELIAADGIVGCAQGAETTYGMVANRFPDLLTTGQSPKGGTGPCKASHGTGTCTCQQGDVTDDCGSGATTCTDGLCADGDADKLACVQNSDCNTADPEVCDFPEPDYILTLEGYNDVLTLYTRGATNSCGGPNGARNIFADGGACDTCPTKACMAPSDCNAAAGRSDDSDCIGHLRGNAVLNNPDQYGCFAPITVGFTTYQCLMLAPACRIDGDCPTGFTCEGASGTAAFDGYCDCGADDAGDPNICDALALGFDCRDGRCRKACSVDADCANGSNYGTCNTDASPTVCDGICDCPSNSADQPDYPNAASCTSDADCPPPYTGRFGIPGLCSGGACICGGTPLCTRATDACQSVAQRGRQHAGDAAGVESASYRLTISSFNDMRAIAAQRTLLDPEGDGPLLHFLTIPFPGKECDGGHGDRVWMQRTNQALRAEYNFPTVIDTASAVVTFSDVVHPDAPGGLAIATHAATFLQALNVCATNAGTLLAAAQSYCQQTDGTWTTTTCDTTADCGSGEACQRRECNEAGDCPDADDACNLETGVL